MLTPERLRIVLAPVIQPFSPIPQPVLILRYPTFAFARTWHRLLKTIRLLFDPFGPNIYLMFETFFKSLISH